MALIKEDKLIIGITGPDEGGLFAWVFTKYALRLAGAKVYRLTPSRPKPPYPLDGLVIGGGADIHPERYGQNIPIALSLTNKASFQQNGKSSTLLRRSLARIGRRLRREVGVGYIQIEPERDEMEFNLLDEAMGREIPILGICRGAQMINVYFGGTLHHDIRGFKFETPYVRSVLPIKRVTIEPESKLAKVMQTTTCYVNSLHKQAVDKLGNNLFVAAKDQNGIVQAVEHISHHFLIGVQWHPEYIPQIANHREIFKVFVEAVRARKRKKN
ncbi:MAG TPA: gamma-glutamyl-gamma-aminobutyrate hydrolase family protein [Thermodesulfobacteriota bacterium]|nr:gamma-glutamyl-gamma-aminobutyrate hydrolase family protein [Thermodesulfobacteriota bacterium]